MQNNSTNRLWELNSDSISQQSDGPVVEDACVVFESTFLNQLQTFINEI